VLDYQRLFHTGVRVVDLEKAMVELGSSLGVTWAEVQERQQAIWQPGVGARTVALRFTYSCEGPQHIELLQGAAGSFWDAAGGAGVHHVGVWSDDVAGETTRLVEAGWALLGAQTSPAEGFGLYTYLAPPSGLLLELVHAAALPRFEVWWAGGSL